MIILDTNVVSEVWRTQPDHAAMAWLDAQPADTLFLCAPVLAELSYGMARLPDGGRKKRFRAAIERLETDLYRGRVLPFDAEAARQYGAVAAHRSSIGRPMSQMDGLIAAIALCHGARLATRNVHDFDGLGLELINPFVSSLSSQ